MQSPDDIETTLRRAALNARGASSDFDLNPDATRTLPAQVKQAAVLIAVSQSGDVILTKRAAHLKNHAGQIAFPGGRMDDTDPDLTHTALREAHEEIGLDPAHVTKLGELPAHDTVTRYRVTPIVAMVPDNLVHRLEPDEVDEVFTVPLRYILDAANYRIEGRYWRGEKRFYYVVPHGPFYIWGATARILRGLAEGAK